MTFGAGIVLGVVIGVLVVAVALYGYKKLTSAD
jgi:hypothetical protein